MANRGGRPIFAGRISSVILDRIKKEAEAMDVTLTGYIQSVLWDHIRELDKPKYQQPIQPVHQGFRAMGN
ncbi:MAG: hypothetical protein K0Q50_197 [Vampirovibrio sp.]|jgi:hypothetical protein|nr:hypothetical protein [Vampirovibrio sp.]